ncbi:MAG: S8 family serine peptidase [Actinobacteria bacterium]|nr:S8 family serine peptidase [Actinomycetota bacterium]
MPRCRTLAAAVLAASLLAVPTAVAAPAASAPDAAARADATENVKVWVAADGDVTAGLLDAVEALGVTRALEVRSIDALAVTTPAALVPALADLPGVRAVVPQRRLTLDLFSSKRQINAHEADQAEPYERGGQTFERPGVTGAGVTVGIIDSGIFAAHPDFGGRVTLGLNFEFTELQQSGGIPAEEWDAYAEATGPTALQDEVGHGTHVAGTVGGDGSAARGDRDLSGVAPGVEMVSLKIASAANGVIEDVGFEENAMFAIDYLIRHPETGVKLTNNSWGLLPEEPHAIPGAGEPTDFPASQEMIAAASAAGITMVFAAGNDGPEPDTIGEDPGGAPSAITVAAACKGEEHGGRCPEGEITDFSSRGKADGSGAQVDVAAPGDNIMAAVSPSILLPLSGCRDSGEPAYYCISGTSMASPHVAGAVALMQEVNPELTPAQAEECLTSTAVDMLEPGVDIHSGHGMIDTEQAIICASQLAGATPVGGSAPAPAPAPDAAPAPTDLPATGGGLAVLALGALGAATALRRQR